MNSQELQICSFEQAKRLKELGFDWKVDGFYWNNDGELEPSFGLCNWNNDEDGISAPTIALALKWFRDEKNEYFSVYYGSSFPNNNKGYFGRVEKTWNCETKLFETYESAESALLDELLTLLEKEL